MTKYYSGDQIKKNEMGGKNLKERDLSLDGRIILKWISKMQAGEAWTGLAQVRTGGRLL
jgi:hypothetical protein